MYKQVSRAWVTRHWGGAEVVLFIVFLFCVSSDRLTRVGINSLLRSKTLNVWGKPFRLAASRVRCTLFREPTPSNAIPGLSVIASDWWILSEAIILVVSLVYDVLLNVS